LLWSFAGTAGQALAGRAKSRLPQDLCHGRRRDGDAEAVQLAGDPLVAPLRVLAASRSTRSRISPPIGGRPRRTAYVQRRATSRRCQRNSVVGVTRNDRQLDRGNSRLAAVSKTRSVIVSCGRLVCRRSTESSCRNTTISSSLNPSERRRRDTTRNKHRNARYQSDQNKTNSSESAGTGARLYGRDARLKLGTELKHPTAAGGPGGGGGGGGGGWWVGRGGGGGGWGLWVAPLRPPPPPPVRTD
jgi:hypothetical protein